MDAHVELLSLLREVLKSGGIYVGFESLVHLVVLVRVDEVLRPEKPGHVVDLLFELGIVGRVLFKCQMRLETFDVVYYILLYKPIKSEFNLIHLHSQISDRITIFIVHLQPAATSSIAFPKSTL